MSIVSADQRTRSRWALLIVAIVFAALFGLVDATGQLIVVATLMLMLGPTVALLSRRQNLDLFQPIWVFVIVFVIDYLYKAALVIADPRQLTFPSYYPAAPNFPLIALVIGLGLAGLAVGYLSSAYRVPERLLPRLGDDQISRERLRTMSLAGVVVGLISLIFLVHGTGGSLSAIFSVDTRSAILGSLVGRGPMLGFVTSMPLFGLGYLYFFVTEDQRTRVQWVTLTAVFLMTLYATAVVGGRNVFLGFIASAVVLVHFTRRRFHAWQQLLLVVVALGLGGRLGLVLLGSGSKATGGLGVVQRLMQSFDGFDNLAIALTRSTIYWGKTIGEDLLYTFVPRALVPGKPVLYGTLRLQDTILPGTLGAHIYGSLPPGVLAEGFLNFGIGGVFLVPLAVGAMLRALQERANNEAGVSLVILALIAGQANALIRGFGSFLASLTFIYALAWLFFRARVPAHR